MYKPKCMNDEGLACPFGQGLFKTITVSRPVGAVRPCRGRYFLVAEQESTQRSQQGGERCRPCSRNASHAPPCPPPGRFVAGAVFPSAVSERVTSQVCCRLFVLPKRALLAKKLSISLRRTSGEAAGDSQGGALTTKRPLGRLFAYFLGETRK